MIWQPSGRHAGRHAGCGALRRMALVAHWPARDFVRSELVSLGEEGPYRLTVLHAQGQIVEYFTDTAAALRRQGELEELLAAARGAGGETLKRAV